jgi:acyl-coenzyme A thioesterase PaaI-like protein
MAPLGAAITEVKPVAVTIELPFRADLTQQHGFLPAGVVEGQ